MKEIKPIHVVVMIILVLLALAVVQWMTLPRKSPAATAGLDAKTDLSEELPTLPQNELYNSPAAPSLSRELLPFQESVGQDILEPKSPAVSNRKAEL